MKNGINWQYNIPMAAPPITMTITTLPKLGNYSHGDFSLYIRSLAGGKLWKEMHQRELTEMGWNIMPGSFSEQEQHLSTHQESAAGTTMDRGQVLGRKIPGVCVWYCIVFLLALPRRERVSREMKYIVMKYSRVKRQLPQQEQHSQLREYQKF